MLTGKIALNHTSCSSPTEIQQVVITLLFFILRGTFNYLQSLQQNVPYVCCVLPPRAPSLPFSLEINASSRIKKGTLMYHFTFTQNREICCSWFPLALSQLVQEEMLLWFQINWLLTHSHLLITKPNLHPHHSLCWHIRNSLAQGRKGRVIKTNECILELLTPWCFGQRQNPFSPLGFLLS